MLYFIDRLLGLRGHLFQTNPDQHGTSDMIPLNPFFAALAGFNPRHLFGLPMKLLNLPAKATRLLDGLHGILSHVVRDDIVRALGRKQQAENRSKEPSCQTRKRVSSRKLSQAQQRHWERARQRSSKPLAKGWGAGPRGESCNKNVNWTQSVQIGIPTRSVGTRSSA